MSCFGCFKNNSGRTQEADVPQEPEAHPKPSNVSQAPPATAMQPVAKVPPAVEKPTSQEPAKEPVKTDAPVVDRWRDAFKSLPEDKQKTLKDMGFDKPRSANVKTSISDLVTSVNERQAECETKFWQVNVGGKDIVFRDYTTSIVGWLEKAGDIAIQFAPPQASLPWDLVKSLMKIPVNESEQMFALLATTERIVRITSRGQVYEQVYLPTKPGVEMQSIHKQLEGALLKIYMTSLELLADSGKLLDQNTAKRTIEAIVNPGKFQGQLSGLKEDEEELLLDVQACEVQRSSDADNTMINMLKTFNDPILRIDEGVAHLLAHMHERDRIDMLEWISSVPFGKHHDAVREDRTPGTGEWLLKHEDFSSWEKKNSSHLFWLQGSPGTGKTYLMSTVIDRIQSQITMKNEGFAFFYCRKGDELRSQPLSILQSFVRQLSTNSNNPESVQTKLRDAVKEAREKGTNFRLKQCKEQILTSLNIYAKSTLVIDAMDECDPESRDELIEALNLFIRDSEKPVKIFISSRPDPGSATALESSSNVGIQASDNQDDIRKYLDIELDKHARRVAVLKRMKPEIMEKLLERSQGTFQWAVLQVHQLAKCQSPPSVRDRLNKLPSTLKDSYDEVWAQINGLEENDKILATRALLWTMAACKPLTTGEILSAIRMDSNGDITPVDEMLDKNGLLSLCNSFLTVDNQLQVWRFPHLSVQEYLESEKHLSLSQAHSHAAKISLSYFINSYEDHDLAQESEPEEPEDSGAEEPLAPESDDGFTKLHPFHIYMRQCWVQHVQRLKDTGAAELSPLLKPFLGSPDESSVQYRRWYQQTTKDFEYFMCKGAFDYYQEPHFGNEELRDLVNELDPEDAAVFAMCRFSLDTILSDWWEDAKIDVSRVNKRGHNLLAIAARAGSLPICKWLMDKGIDVNSRLEGFNHGNALVAAASQGHTEVVKYLVEAGAEVNMVLSDEEGQFDNALAAAIDCGSLETTKYLIQKAGADISLPLPRSSYGFALGAAANIPGTGMVKLLLDAGADVNMHLPSKYEETALVIKIKNGELDGVEYLVKKAKADVNMPLTYHYGSALEAAVSRGDLDIAKWLVKEGGANVNAQSTSGIYGSALASAAFHEIEAVKFLVKAGADINSPLLVGSYGSALAVGCAEGGIEIVQYLLSAGADPNMRLMQGIFGSALAAAAYEAIEVDIVKALVEAGADINTQIEHGDFGCALAAAGVGGETGDIDVFPYLVEAGANINMPLKHGVFGSPFAATVWGRQFEKIKLLVDKGVDVNMLLENNDFCNPLAMVAAFTWGEGTVEYVLETGVKVNPEHPGRIYGSPLIAAAAFGQKECVEYLIKAGADVNQTFENSYYATALQAAQAEFSPDDKKWMLRFFGGNEDDLEEIVEEWGEEKPGVVELLKERGATA